MHDFARRRASGSFATPGAASNNSGSDSPTAPRDPTRSKSRRRMGCRVVAWVSVRYISLLQRDTRETLRSGSEHVLYQLSYRLADTAQLRGHRDSHDSLSRAGPCLHAAPHALQDFYRVLRG